MTAQEDKARNDAHWNWVREKTNARRAAGVSPFTAEGDAWSAEYNREHPDPTGRTPEEKQAAEDSYNRTRVAVLEARHRHQSKRISELLEENRRLRLELVKALGEVSNG